MSIYLHNSIIGEIPEGEFIAIIISIILQKNVMTSFGEQNKIVITYETEEGYIKKQSYNAVLNAASKLGQVVNNLLDTSTDEKIDVEQLIGKKCLITTHRNTTDSGSTFINVVNVQAMTSVNTITTAAVVNPVSAIIPRNNSINKKDIINLFDE